MAIPCPHCNQPVRRASTEGAYTAGGLVGMLFCSAMADFECPRCGKILEEEFPPEIRAQVKSGSYILLLVAGAIFAVATAFGALYALR
jgi:hypothetical protein